MLGFFLAAYLDYDICIWSQTSWIWLETKLAELGMVGDDRPYKVSLAAPGYSATTYLICIDCLCPGQEINVPSFHEARWEGLSTPRQATQGYLVTLSSIVSRKVVSDCPPDY